jgi:hypothetical protein
MSAIETFKERPTIKLNLYKAGDFSEQKPKWLHMSGQGFTYDKTYAWCGTIEQFINLSDIYDLSNYSLIPNSQT